MDEKIKILSPNSQAFLNHIENKFFDGNIYTFWSLEDLYPNNRFRYHLGHFSMIEKINLLLNQGKNVHAIICDPDHIIMRGSEYKFWENVVENWNKFIKINIDRAIVIERLSNLIRIERPNEILFNFKKYLTLVLSKFREIVLEKQLSEGEKVELLKYRQYHHDEIDKKLTELLKRLRASFQVDDKLLLFAAYVHFFRPSWFSSNWLADCILFLTRNSMDGEKIVLEANRNAYSWLSMRSFFEMTKIEFEKDGCEFPFQWPKTAFMDSLYSTNGDTFMGINDANSCIFIDSKIDALKHQIKQLDYKVKQNIDYHFFDGQQKTKSTSWDGILLNKIIKYQTLNLQFLRQNQIENVEVGSKIKAKLYIDDLYDYPNLFDNELENTSFFPKNGSTPLGKEINQDNLVAIFFRTNTDFDLMGIILFEDGHLNKYLKTLSRVRKAVWVNIFNKNEFRLLHFSGTLYNPKFLTERESNGKKWLQVHDNEAKLIIQQQLLFEKDLANFSEDTHPFYSILKKMSINSDL